MSGADCNFNKKDPPRFNSLPSSAGVRGPASRGRVPTVGAPAGEGEEHRDGWVRRAGEEVGYGVGVPTAWGRFGVRGRE